jgi:hypothetical protein
LDGIILDLQAAGGSFRVFDDQHLTADLEDLIPHAHLTPSPAWESLAVASEEGSLPSRRSFSSQLPSDFTVDYEHDLRWSNLSPLTLSAGSPSTGLDLVRRWFEEVCPAWSGFDSNSNMNRELAGSLWQSSEPVFMCLQSMAASFVTSRLPRMHQPALRLLKKAVSSVQADIASNATLYYSIPTTSLFSLLCLGTSVCWLDAQRVGSPFLRQAKKLLEQMNLQPLFMDTEQLRILRYFEKSLLYWEMLVSVVADGEAEPGAERQDCSGDTSVVHVTRDENVADMLPHPWTGISSLSSQLFGQAVRLCRVYRQGITNPTGRASSLLTAMQRIDEARKLEERILELDFAYAAYLGDTGDTRTPRSHLVQVAEAYQLASLLQLYITFPDLVSLRLPHEMNASQAGDVPWNKWIVPLALRLVNVLGRIPPESGSRMMQPLLYICAGAGLRRDTSTAIYDSVDGLCIIRSATPSLGLKDGHMDMMAYVDQLDEGVDEDATAETTFGAAMDVGEARNFINARLDLLKRTLHPNPIVVTAQLLKAVWAAYDAEPAGSTSVHWFDVMDRTGLRSLFG